MLPSGQRSSSIRPGTGEAQFFAEHLVGIQNLLSCQYQMVPGDGGWWVNRREKARLELNQRKAQKLVEEVLNFIQREPSEPVKPKDPTKPQPDKPVSYIGDGGAYQRHPKALPEAQPLEQSGGC